MISHALGQNRAFVVPIASVGLEQERTFAKLRNLFHLPTKVHAEFQNESQRSQKITRWLPSKKPQGAFLGAFFVFGSLLLVALHTLAVVSYGHDVFCSTGEEDVGVSA